MFILVAGEGFLVAGEGFLVAGKGFLVAGECFMVVWEGFLVAAEDFLVAAEGFISFSIFGKLLPYLEGCFSCFMSGWPRSTLDKTSPSKPDNVVVQFILFPEDNCNASI
jgi:hypothetical protein